MASVMDKADDVHSKGIGPSLAGLPFYSVTPASKYLASPDSTVIPPSPSTNNTVTSLAVGVSVEENAAGIGLQDVLCDPSCIPVHAGGLTTGAHTADDICSSSPLPVEKLYKLAMKFYKDKEGTKALQISYSDRLKLIGLTKQITYGKYSADKSADVGFLDVVGNDRRQAWVALGDMSKVNAMNEFIRSITTLCPSFTHYVKAHEVEILQQLQQIRDDEEAERKRADNDGGSQQTTIAADDDEIIKSDEEILKCQQLEQQIRDALNQQTSIQFKQYAKQQFPESQEQQDTLISQLQEQHFQQYIQQVHSQQVLHQRQQYLQLHALNNRRAARRANAQNDNSRTGDDCITKTDDVVHDEVVYQNGELDGSGGCENPLEEGEGYEEGEGGEAEYDHFEGQEGTPGAEGEEFAEGGEGEGEDESDIDDAEPCYSLEEMPPLIPASLWTRGDIREFKDSVRKNPENVIKVSSLSTATVRVPTHENGTSVFWEFATDSYDLGFGVYFEWNITPPSQVSIQVSESSDEEDAEDEEGGVAAADPEGNTKGDVEKGNERKKDSGPPMDEIIQVYRRDCHLEVYCGSHTYPGRGVYLLKFDNSYSLWRSKTVYYRVFYSK